jgi:broad specificity phosphatase PhoE
LNKTTIGVLRHGQTDWNIDFRLQGVTDIPMNETGIAQARDAATAIDANEWDSIITSPLSRARETAEIVAAVNGLGEVLIEPLLLERSFGEAEGMAHEEWRAKYSDTNLVPGGESLGALEARANLLLDTLVANHEGRKVLAVSHGALIRVLLRIVSNGEFPRDGERLGNASLCVLIHDESGWQVERYEPRTLHSDLLQ